MIALIHQHVVPATVGMVVTLLADSLGSACAAMLAILAASAIQQVTRS